MNKKSILIDVDEVICDSGILYFINRFLGTNYKTTDFTDYYIDDVIGNDEKKQQFYEYLLQQNCYQNAELLPNAYEVIKDLHEKYDIYICSACVNPFIKEKSGIFFLHKYEFLVRTFPFLDPDKFIFTSTKNRISADIQIDDRLPNLKGDIPCKLLFSSYHNLSHTNEELAQYNVNRVSGWDEIRSLLLP